MGSLSQRERAGVREKGHAHSKTLLATQMQPAPADHYLNLPSRCSRRREEAETCVRRTSPHEGNARVEHPRSGGVWLAVVLWLLAGAVDARAQSGFITAGGARRTNAPAAAFTAAPAPGFTPRVSALPAPTFGPVSTPVNAAPAFAQPAPATTSTTVVRMGPAASVPAPSQPAAVAPRVPAAPVSLDGIPPEARMALTAAMPVEHRKFLLHLYAQLGQVEIAERLAARILTEAPGDRQTQLTLASMYLEQKRTAQALDYAQRLAQAYPNDAEVLYQLGAAHYQAGQWNEASAVLRALKRDRFDQKPFPYQNDLASSALNAGDWRGATEAYRELLANHTLPDAVRAETRGVLERLYREHLPRLSAEATGVLVGSGEVLRTRVDFRTHLTDRSKVFVTASREDTHVKEAPQLRDRRAANMDGVVGLETTHNTNWTTALWLGGNGSSPQGGASVTRRLGERGELNAEANYAERAADGLLIESLNGRQNRLALSAQYLLTGQWNVYGQVSGREVTIDRTQVGRGYGATWGLEHIFLHGVPDLRLGYRGAAINFSRRTSDTSLVDAAAAPGTTLAGKTTLLDGLVTPHFHREGGYLNWSDRLGSTFSYQLGAGADYAFDRDSMEFNALAGLTWYPIRRLELHSGVGYASGARTSDAASDQWEFNIALRWWF